jgi:YD repeat-containing protein
VVDVTTVASGTNPETIASELLDGSVAETFLTPSPLRAYGTSYPSSLANPPPPQFHYYVLVRASGALGPMLKLAIESTDRRGNRLTARGLLNPPVILTGHSGSAGVENLQPAATAQVARRLSDDANSVFYNVYLSQPFLVARDPVSPAILGEIAAVPGRQAVQLGERLRLSLEDADEPGAFSALFTFTPNPDQPPGGISYSVDSFCADFVDSLNPSPRGASPKVEGVSLQSGEFSHTATDYFIEGRGQPLVLTRTYESQSHYNGPFGRGWNFNFNRRLCDLPSGLVPAEFKLPLTFYGAATLDRVAQPGDVLCQSGDGELLLYRKIDAQHGNLAKLPLFSSDPAIQEFGWTGKIASFYEPPPGQFDALFRFTDGTYVAIDPSATRIYFNADGRLERIVPPYSAAQIKLNYRANGKLARVEGDRGISLEFGYYGKTTAPDFVNSLDKPAAEDSHLGLVARVKAGPDNVEYQYDAEARLKTVEGAAQPLDYGYDQNAPFQLTSIGIAGGQPPHQTITYTDGLVTEITTPAGTHTFGGAKATAEERKSAGSADVTVTIGGAPGANIGVNDKGEASEFAGAQIATDASGSISAMTLHGRTASIVRDTTNTVFRFRGNVLNVSSGQSQANSVYDGSAWNRLESQTAPDGVTTAYDYSNLSAGVHPGRTVTLTTGPNVRESRFNEWGVLESEEWREGGVTFRNQVQFDFAEGLPVGLKRGGLVAVEFTRAAGKVSSVSVGGQSFATPTFNSDGQSTGFTGAAGFPSVSFGFDAEARIMNSTVSAGGQSVSDTFGYDPQNATQVQTVMSQETGLPDESIGYSYDPEGRVTGVSGAEGATTIGYTGIVPTSETGPGVNRSLQLAGDGTPMSITEQGIVTTPHFDGQGRLDRVESQGARREISYASGASDRVGGQKVIDLNGAGTLLDVTYSYDSAGRVSTVTSGNRVWTRTYFPDGTLRKTDINGFTAHDFTKNDAALITGASYLNGAYSVSQTDFHPVSGKPRSKTFRLINGATISETIGYDNIGRQTSRARAGLAPDTFTYDDFGNLTSVTDADGVSKNFVTSPSGFP